MKTEIELAIKALLVCIKNKSENEQSGAAMQLSQAALNLAHTAQVIDNTK